MAAVPDDLFTGSIASRKRPAFQLDLVDLDIAEELSRFDDQLPFFEAPRAEAAPVAEPPPRIRTLAELESAMDALARRPLKRLGEALVEAGHVRPAQVRAALDQQKERPGRQLGEILVALGAVTSQQVKKVLAQGLGIPTVDVKEFPGIDAARARVPEAVCLRHRMLPLVMREGALVVAMDNPTSAEALEAARFSSGLRVVPVLASGEEIRDVLRGRASAAESWNEAPLTLAAGPAPAARPAFGTESLEFDLSGVEELASRLTEELVRQESPAEDQDLVRESDSTLVRLVNKIILDAHQTGASDVHIEPAPGGGELRVRMRRDGVLADYAVLPSKFRSALVSRIKIMANLDIAERRRPQDGKIDFAKFGPARIELRVATLPTVNGQENVVMRVLASASPRPLDSLGIEAGILARMKALADRPHGLLLVCGPTGSGKTTTLHSLISSLNTAERKIWTAEDPVEITQPGLCQVQVNPKVDLTFASALRSFLRADPDVIMVGEMRDAETASTAVEASLTGHLVLSTLHTNSAPETVTRLLDLGVDSFNFGDTLLGVLAQRLVRVACPHCARKAPASRETLDALALEYCAGTALDPKAVADEWAAGTPVIAQTVGCEQCGGTGYRGRMGLYEFMEVSPATASLIRRRAGVPELRAQAVAEGMRSLKQDGIAKVLRGETTMSQVRAAAPA